LVKELKNRGFWVRVLIRKESQKAMFFNSFTKYCPKYPVAPVTKTFIVFIFTTKIASEL